MTLGGYAGWNIAYNILLSKGSESWYSISAFDASKTEGKGISDEKKKKNHK